MKILCEQHVPPKYLNALRSERWATVKSTSEEFDDDDPDDEIAVYAARNEWVVLTRDRDFFQLVSTYDCGVLYLDQRRDPFASDLVNSIREIKDAHTDYSDIAESIPGDWV